MYETVQNAQNAAGNRVWQNLTKVSVKPFAALGAGKVLQKNRYALYYKILLRKVRLYEYCNIPAKAEANGDQKGSPRYLGFPVAPAPDLTRPHLLHHL